MTERDETGRPTDRKTLKKILDAHPFEDIIYTKLAPVVEILDEPQPGFHKQVMSQVERALYRLAMERTDGNQSRAATLLGVSRNTLRTRLKTLGLTGKREKR